MTEIILSIITITVLILSYLERKELNDRLMAKSLMEYKSVATKDEANKLPDSEEGVSIEDAKELIDGE